MVLQTTDRGCLNVDVLNSDFRCKWPSKYNFSELDISQSLVWQCPSLSPYFLLNKTYIEQCFVVVCIKSHSGHKDAPLFSYVDCPWFLFLSLALIQLKVL